MTLPANIEKYGTRWPADSTALGIEMVCIQKGGRWKKKNGEYAGNGLAFHYKAFQKLLWPQKDWHRWNELLLSKFCEQRVIGILGPASSGKTHEAASYGLSTYFCFPDETTVLISSTDSRSLELRIWGEIKKHWDQARQQHDHLPGHLLDAKQAISTTGAGDGPRDLRNGIIGIPCVQNGTFVGLGKYVGIKNKRVLLIADECQFMSSAFLDAIANLSKNPGFQCIALGNPKERTDVLGKICEPSDSAGGWDGVDQQTEKTKTWPTRFQEGVCVQLVGTDSPNHDVPESEPTPFPYLITRKAIESDAQFYGRESLQFSMMNLGMMPKETTSRRVITRSLCAQYHAFDEISWSTTDRTKIFAVDAAYGSVGGDRCVGGEIQFGADTRGRQTLAVIGQPIIIPVSGKLASQPEDQIAIFVREECMRRGIEPQNVFYDSTGRGSLGTAFAREWSSAVNPVEFGGKASDRIVASSDQRLCHDIYSKFVTELWFSVRLIVESDQFRQLPESIMEEGTMREWKLVTGNRYEIESKADMKKRMGRSPDLFDMLATAVEGARRRGFQISKIGNPASSASSSGFWKEVKERNRKLRENHQLSYVA